MTLVSLALLSLTLGYAVFQRAGVALADWNLCLVATGAAGVVHFLVPHRSRIPIPDRIAVISASVFLGVAALQLLPLPVTVVRVLSPARVELLQATQPVMANLPKFVTLSVVPYQTLEYLLTLGGYAVVLLLVRELTLRSSSQSWRTVWPLLIIGGLEAALGLYQASTGPTEHATGTYANRDHFAGLLEMILPFAAAYSLALFQREPRQFTSRFVQIVAGCAILAIAIALLAAIIQSVCRMAFLASLAGLFAGGTLALSSKRLDSKRPLRWRGKLLPFAGLGLAVFFAFVLLPHDALMGRFTELASTENVSADARGQIWRDTVGLIKAFPIFGCGLGGFQSCFLRFKTVAPMNTVDYAHNDYLQVLAEVGVIGFVAGLLFVGRLLYRTLRAVRAAHSVDERYLAIACVSSMTAMLLHSLVDFNMYVPANGMVFAWVAGIASIHAQHRLRRSTPTSPRVGPVLH
jgi:O-antigen ligase